jgi:hypothetical protein
MDGWTEEIPAGYQVPSHNIIMQWNNLSSNNELLQCCCKWYPDLDDELENDEV